VDGLVQAAARQAAEERFEFPAVVTPDAAADAVQPAGR
jgi:hypothetical protein